MVEDSAAGTVMEIPVVLPITLGQFLKYVGSVHTGGEAKQLIATGSVRVNGEVETHRGRKLVHGDQVTVGAVTYGLSAP